MNHPSEIAECLRGNLVLYESLLALVEEEGEALRGPGEPGLGRHAAGRRDLLPKLKASLEPLARCRSAWHAISPAERARHPEVAELIRQNQDLLMKILFLDRSNEQSLLRHGLVPPKELPSVNRQRPHFVADMYRRGGR